MKVVISIGGSLLTKETDISNPDSYTKNFKRYAEVVRKILRDGNQVVAVCGGGDPARIFQNIGRKFTKDTEVLDRLGILATSLNAQLFVACLNKLEAGIVHEDVISSPQDIGYIFYETKGKKVIVCSGWEPGCSTDYDATLHAEAVGAKLIINATNIDGVYTSDPKKNPNAKKIDALSYEDFRKILSGIPQTPGEYRLFDLKGIDVIERNDIKMIIVDGNDPIEILRAMEGTHKGTVVG